VYSAYSDGTPRLSHPHTQLRGVAVLFPNAIHLVAREDSGIAELRDLAGRTLTSAVPGTGTGNDRSGRIEAIAWAIARLASNGAMPVRGTAPLNVGGALLEERNVDAVAFYGGVPFQPVTDAARRFAIRLLPFDDEALSLAKSRYPFLKRVVIPAGTYPGQPQALPTLGVDNVLVCRADLPADLVYKLTATLYSGLGALSAAHPSAADIVPSNGPATLIPLHDGATRYYREKQLFE
jgi:TRAP transporter TAXI family solute receptor